MANLTLVYGGCRSGKSEYAKDLSRGRVCFIATAHPVDEEMIRRIENHQRERPDDWETIESPLHIDSAILACSGKADTVLVDCMSFYLSNMMGLHDLDIPRAQELCAQDLITQLDKIIGAAEEFGGNVIFVSNETGQGIVPDNSLGRFYRDLSGIMNQALAAACDHVIKVEVGIPVTIK